MSLIVINCSSLVHLYDYNFALYYIKYNIANKCLKYIISLYIYIITYYRLVYPITHGSQQVKFLATCPSVTICIY